MPGGIPSSRYMSWTISPVAHSPSPVLHSTVSPMAKRSAASRSAVSSGESRQLLKASLSAFGSRPLPMKTSLDSRGSPSAHGASKEPSMFMWTAWKTKRRLLCAIASTPFIR